MKRPSCKWKGQTDADEVSTGSAGSPISRMPQRTKGGLRPTRQPSKTSQCTERTPQCTEDTPRITEALAYWQKELSSRAESTKNVYLQDFTVFLDYEGKTADELLAQREQDETSKDRKIQRRIESLLNEYIAAKRKEGYSPATLQRYFAAVRSFFDTHYTPLRMRRNDYPKGESLGVRAATRELIRKADTIKTLEGRKVYPQTPNLLLLTLVVSARINLHCLCRIFSCLVR